MSFSDQIRVFAVKADTTSKVVFPNSVSAAHSSITVGSGVTGSPGQPVDTGELRTSWQIEFESPTSATISTGVPWARQNEDGVTEDGRPYMQRSPVGGRHSVALTIVGMQRLVDAEAAKVTA